MKVIEIGCGTGTFSLVLNLLGAETTLLDIDENALEAAEKIFSIYNRSATYIKANILNPLPQEFRAKFDLVVSGGLVEHFQGPDREKAIVYHRLLLNDRGFAYIGVPNRISPFYRLIRIASKIFGQWKITTEIPFSHWELKRIGKKVGFPEVRILGSATLKEDSLIYSAAFGALILRIFPESLKKLFKENIFYRKIVGLNSDNQDIRGFIQAKVEAIKKKHRRQDFQKSIKDYLSSGLILFGLAK